MRDPETFAKQFFTAIREGTDNTNATSLAMYAFEAMRPSVVLDWAKWAVRNLGEASITAPLLLYTCLGPSGQPTSYNWLFETAWGQYVMGHCAHDEKGEAASAALLAIVLIMLTSDDWDKIAVHMNRVPVVIEPLAHQQKAP